MKRVLTVLAAVALSLAALAAPTATASASNPASDVQRIVQSDGVVLYRGVETPQQLASLCDGRFCAWSADVATMAYIPATCGVTFNVPASWKATGQGEWYNNMAYPKRVKMYQGSAPVYTTGHAPAYDTHADWLKVSTLQVIC
ncbi:hypothetical protein ABTX81_33050 [Kitasatospora sp. NPDC097605]|uniref:hypothetical protein n=1 Tax=Kitasatospora sp. NPDC097605 TaxID=3157226 RepID=UPI00332CC902